MQKKKKAYPNVLSTRRRYDRETSSAKKRFLASNPKKRGHAEYHSNSPHTMRYWFSHGGAPGWRGKIQDRKALRKMYTQARSGKKLDDETLFILSRHKDARRYAAKLKAEPTGYAYDSWMGYENLPISSWDKWHANEMRKSKFEFTRWWD